MSYTLIQEARDAADNLEVLLNEKDSEIEGLNAKVTELKQRIDTLEDENYDLRQTA